MFSHIQTRILWRFWTRRKVICNFWWSWYSLDLNVSHCGKGINSKKITYSLLFWQSHSTGCTAINYPKCDSTYNNRQMFYIYFNKNLLKFLQMWCGNFAVPSNLTKEFLESNKKMCVDLVTSLNKIRLVSLNKISTA